MLKTVLPLALAAVAAARHCQNITVPVSLTSRNAVFDLQPPSTEIEVTNFFLRMSWPGNNASAKVLKDVSPSHSTGIPAGPADMSQWTAYN
jgi:hypothetical protein